jgi:hypothetical protein
MYDVENMSRFFCCDHFGYTDVDDNIMSSLYPLVPVFHTLATFLCEIQRMLIPACRSVGTEDSFPEGKLGGVSSCLCIPLQQSV